MSGEQGGSLRELVEDGGLLDRAVKMLYGLGEHAPGANYAAIKELYVALEDERKRLQGAARDALESAQPPEPIAPPSRNALAAALRARGVVNIHGCLLACTGGPHLPECAALQAAISDYTAAAQPPEPRTTVDIVAAMIRESLDRVAKMPDPEYRTEEEQELADTLSRLAQAMNKALARVTNPDASVQADSSPEVTDAT